MDMRDHHGLVYRGIHRGFGAGHALQILLRGAGPLPLCHYRHRSLDAGCHQEKDSTLCASSLQQKKALELQMLTPQPLGNEGSILQVRGQDFGCHTGHL